MRTKQTIALLGTTCSASTKTTEKQKMGLIKVMRKNIML